MTSNGTQVMSPQEIESTRVTPNGTSKEGTKSSPADEIGTHPARGQDTSKPVTWSSEDKRTQPDETKWDIGRCRDTNRRCKITGPQETRGPIEMRPNGELAAARFMLLGPQQIRLRGPSRMRPFGALATGRGRAAHSSPLPPIFHLSQLNTHHHHFH